MQALVAGGDTIVLVGGDGPAGLAVLRFREAIWDEASSATWPSCTWCRAGGGASGGR